MDKLGLSSTNEIPVAEDVAEENRRHDEWLANATIATVVACWVGLSIAAGVTANDTFAGIGTFLFLGVLAWLLYAIMGGDIGLGS